MNDFINLRNSNRKVLLFDYAFITPILRPPSDCAFLALGPNSGSILWLWKEPRNPHACEMALPLSAGHPQDIRGRA